jgi:hypothetical protein
MGKDVSDILFTTTQNVKNVTARYRSYDDDITILSNVSLISTYSTEGTSLRRTNYS